MSQIRVFRAATVSQALAEVRAALGGDALILGQREVRKRPFPWHRVVTESEVTAGIGTTGGTAAAHETTSARSSVIALPNSRRPALHDRVRGENAPGAAPGQNRRFAMHGSGPHHRWQDDGWNPFLLYQRLVDSGATEADARQLAEQFTDWANEHPAEAANLRHREQVVHRLIHACWRSHRPIHLQPGNRRCVALVGPTGVGKTTTLAKLAARYRLDEKLRVAVMTLDTFRMGAVDQLRAFCDLLEIPLRVIASDRELPSALVEFADFDLVLIDTAGCNPLDQSGLHELRESLHAAQAQEIHLVLSLATDSQSITRAANAFAPLKPTQVLLTKRDEAIGDGCILSAARRLDAPLSYIATGQNVPDDLEAFDPGVWTDRLLSAAVHEMRAQSFAAGGRGLGSPQSGSIPVRSRIQPLTPHWHTEEVETN
jgi:flagellar biosynthesis protein FlhF